MTRSKTANRTQSSSQHSPPHPPADGAFLAALVESAELAIIERLTGEIGVESEPGKGSIFWFTLPSTI